jgi:hypothetical protein
MKTDTLKKLIKEAVKEVIQEELKDILLEAIKSNKQPLKESYQVSDDRTLNFNTNSLNNFIPSTTTNPRQAYMDILNDMAQGPESGFKGEFKVNGPINTMAEGSALPQGQLGLDQIMNLISK